MKDLSVAQEYLLCSLTGQGKLPLLNNHVPGCVLAGGLIELLADGSVQIGEKDKISVTGDLGAERTYLRSLYEWLGKSGPVSLNKVAQTYCVTLTGRQINALVDDIGDSLVQNGCATPEMGGVFGKKRCFLPRPEAVDRVIQKIRAELLESGAIDEETVALVSLMEKSSQIKKYFSKYESDQLKARLKEIRQAPSSQMVKRIVDYIDKMIAVITAPAVIP